MQAILCEVIGPPPSWLAALADEMVEDPRCRAMTLGSDDAGTLLITLWDSEAAKEVADHLHEQPDTSVRVLRVEPSQVFWG